MFRQGFILRGADERPRAILDVEISEVAVFTRREAMPRVRRHVYKGAGLDDAPLAPDYRINLAFEWKRHQFIRMIVQRRSRARFFGDDAKIHVHAFDHRAFAGRQMRVKMMHFKIFKTVKGHARLRLDLFAQSSILSGPRTPGAVGTNAPPMPPPCRNITPAAV